MRIKGTIIFLIFGLSVVTQIYLLSFSPTAFTPAGQDTQVQIGIEGLCFQVNGEKPLVLILLPAFVSSPRDAGIDAFDREKVSVRDMVYRVIASQPGIHFRELCRALNKKNGVIQYHLWALETIENRIRSHQDGRFTRYFPVNAGLPDIPSDSYYALISVLKHPRMYEIVDLLRNVEDGLSRKVIASELGISRQAVTFNCKKLTAAGVITTSLLNREKHYTLTNEALTILGQLNGS